MNKPVEIAPTAADRLKASERIEESAERVK